MSLRKLDLVAGDRLVAASWVALLFFFAVSGDVQASTDLSARVAVETGLLEGERAGGLVVFRGVPYAAPPIGESRWRPPEPAHGWLGVRAARKFSPNCRQPVIVVGFGPYSHEYMDPRVVSEDCLYLNVWARPRVGAAPAPVLVFIHGGAFSGGSGAVPIYDGANFARHGVVVVTLNYRLGVYGFLNHPELRKEDANAAAASYGLLDVLTALRWVNRNIDAFGGDPQRVTLAGQSAGGELVNEVLETPAARDLYSAAIVESAPPGSVPRNSKGTADRISARLLELLEVRSIEALRRVSSETIERAVDQLSQQTDLIGAGELLFTPTLTLREPQSWQSLPVDVPVLAGITRDEAWRLRSRDAFLVDVRSRYGTLSDRFLALYPAETKMQARIAASDSSRDRLVSGLIAWNHARQGRGASPLFAYIFTHVEPGDSALRFGAFHTSEVPYVFGTLDKAPERMFTAVDRRISRDLVLRWLAFLRRRDPNVRGLVRWPSADLHSFALMGIGESEVLQTLPAAERLQFFMDFFAGGGRPSLF